MRGVLYGLILVALSGTVIVQQMELSSLQSLVFAQSKAIKDLAEDSVKNSESISGLADASIEHSKALRSVNESLRILGGLKRPAQPHHKEREEQGE